MSKVKDPHVFELINAIEARCILRHHNKELPGFVCETCSKEVSRLWLLAGGAVAFNPASPFLDKMNRSPE